MRNCQNKEDMDVLVDLPAGAHVRYDLIGTVDGELGVTIENTASVMVPEGVTDSDTTNNSSTKDVLIVPVGVFANVFEPQTGLLSVLAAEAARVRVRSGP